MTFSFQVVHVNVSMHKMLYRIENVIYVWRHNSPILAHMQLFQKKKEKSLILEQSFDVQIVCIHCTVYYLERNIFKKEKKEQN